MLAVSWNVFLNVATRHGESNSQGRNLGRLVTAARTCGLSSIQGDLGESGKGILKPVYLKQV